MLGTGKWGGSELSGLINSGYCLVLERAGFRRCEQMSDVVYLDVAHRICCVASRSRFEYCRITISCAVMMQVVSVLALFFGHCVRGWSDGVGK